LIGAVCWQHVYLTVQFQLIRRLLTEQLSHNLIVLACLDRIGNYQTHLSYLKKLIWNLSKYVFKLCIAEVDLWMNTLLICCMSVSYTAFLMVVYYFIISFSTAQHVILKKLPVS
jgi:hypothetical protein